MHHLPRFNSSWTTRVDDRDRRDRIETQMNYWDIQMSHLVEAYLKYLAESDDAGCTSMPALVDGALAPSFTINVLDMFCK